MSVYTRDAIEYLIDNDQIEQIALIYIQGYEPAVAFWRADTQQVLLQRGVDDYYLYDDGNIVAALIQYYGLSADVIFAANSINVYRNDEEDSENMYMESMAQFRDRMWSDYPEHGLHFHVTLRLVTNEEHEEGQ